MMCIILYTVLDGKDSQKDSPVGTQGSIHMMPLLLLMYVQEVLDPEVQGPDNPPLHPSPLHSVLEIS